MLARWKRLSRTTGSSAVPTKSTSRGDPHLDTPTTTGFGPSVSRLHVAPTANAIETVPGTSAPTAMSNDRVDHDRPSGPPTHEVCPHCDAPGARLSLLTSMTRYYVCGQCASRWQVERTREGDGSAMALSTQSSGPSRRN